LKKTYEDNSGKVVLAKDVASNQGDFILCFSFWDLNELPSIQPRAGSLYVFSSSEPHNEEQEMDFRRLHQWLKWFGLRGFGLPIERDGKLLIPVHTEKPEFYEDNLNRSGIDVVLPAEGGTVEI
jgi:ribonuclease J